MKLEIPVEIRNKYSLPMEDRTEHVEERQLQLLPDGIRRFREINNRVMNILWVEIVHIEMFFQQFLSKEKDDQIKQRINGIKYFTHNSSHV
jgi:polynucleotide 5'-kinase involved in rRNA processing